MGMVQANVKKMEKEVDTNLLGPKWNEVQMSDVSEYIKARNLLKDEVKSNISGKSKRTQYTTKSKF